jgi:hypothetical protein
VCVCVCVFCVCVCFVCVCVLCVYVGVCIINPYENGKMSAGAGNN